MYTTTTTNNNRQPTTPVTKFSIGVHRILQQGGLVWTFSLTQGEFTLRIPVTIAMTTTSAATATASVKNNAVMSWFCNNSSWQLAYISLLSHIIHDILADILQLNEPNASTTTTATTATLTLQQQHWLQARDKARHEATLQQQFMAKQAKIRTDAERELEGLVITRAVYSCYKGPDDDGDDDNNNMDKSLDVTIPLQFWVADSSLQLPASSKANMLGFYNVAIVPSATTTTTTSSSLPESSSFTFWKNPLQWLSGLWTVDTTSFGTNQQASSLSNHIKLTVQYDYAGRSYEITILDPEELILPNPKARLVGRHPEPVAE